MNTLIYSSHWIRLVALAMLMGLRLTHAADALPATLPAHPRILLNAKDLPDIKKRSATQPGARTFYASLIKQADDWLKTAVTLPPRGGQWFHYYSCPKHGARLKMESPTKHVCPVDKEVLTGYPYDDVALMGDHNRLAAGLKTLGLAYQFTQDRRYAVKARAILMAYVDKYPSYALHNIKGEAKVGGGKVGPQTLDESTWLITMVQGTDCIWSTLSIDDCKKAADNLFYPATKVIRDHKMNIHNIQCWKNSAVGLTGLLLGDMALVNEALNEKSGYYQQMAKGVSADGLWYEGAWGYHFYTMSAVSHLAEGAWHCGINLYTKDYQRMFDGPINFAMPDFVLPPFNDSGTVRVPGAADLYEIACARYKDDRYKLVISRGNRSCLENLLAGVPDAGAMVEFTPATANYTNSGYATLVGGKGTKATWFCVDYGPHGGGHGHPDKLSFVAYGLEQVIAPDPGTANYGVPIQAGWFRTSIAHNTLSIDEDSQKPAEGKSEAFLKAAGFSAVMASAGKISEGVTFRRTTALIGDDYLLFIDQVRADKEHTFDLAYHNYGKLNALANAQPFTPASKPGYSYLRDTRSVISDKPLELSFDMAKAGTVKWLSGGGQAFTHITGTGVGRHTEDRVPLVITRIKGKELAHPWALAIGQMGKVTVTAEPVRRTDNQPVSTSELSALRLVTDAGQHILVANTTGQSVKVVGLTCEGRVIHLVAAADGKFALAHSAR